MAAGRVIRDRDEIRRVLASMPRPVVFTNGCFDILHRGHVAYLARAAALGNTLVVGVNSDESVRRLDKGGDRPFNTLEDRMAVLAALACVDLVVPFDEDTPAELIEAVQPDHLVKGGDWPLDQIVGADTVRRRGGEVHSIPFEYERSTTSLIERIRRSGSRYKGS
ncbi:MAG TPA: D-glycero-beta-D-manno-heptose 1-phosphate adenylyltransferase [Arenicellales bacterium]|nr:D-glycero-beta-D-manno-heptose 1-phosphate adenylyltransferase [Arenicellales bacterium]